MTSLFFQDGFDHPAYRVHPCGGVARWDQRMKHWTGETWQGKRMLNASLDFNLGQEGAFEALTAGVGRLPDEWPYMVHDLGCGHQQLARLLASRVDSCIAMQHTDDEFLLLDSTQQNLLGAVWRLRGKSFVCINCLHLAPIVLAAVREVECASARITSVDPEHTIASLPLDTTELLACEIQSLMSKGEWTLESISKGGLTPYVSLAPFLAKVSINNNCPDFG